MERFFIVFIVQISIIFTTISCFTRNNFSFFTLPHASHFVYIVSCMALIN